MKLTIGMPTLYDYSGVIFTVKCLLDRLKEWDNYQNEVEILIVDNTASPQYRKALEDQLKDFQNKNIRYVPFLVERGPAEVKNYVIENAKGEYTMCLDCHVILQQGVIGKLKNFINSLDGKQKLDFYTGPLESNSGKLFTHFDPVWRNQMWGTWATDVEGLKQDKPFPIWGNGCGLFLVNTAEWLGFNKNFKGFGAEEGYIHEKYRQNHRKVLCIPWLIWWHRFGNPDSKQYSLTVFGKVRNYLLGFTELGLDTKPIYDHFVSLDFSDHGDLRTHMTKVHGVTKESMEKLTDEQIQTMHRYNHKISEYNWNRLLQDPISNDAPEENVSGNVFEALIQDTTNDLREFFPLMRKYAGKCQHVADISRSAASIIPLLVDKPKQFWNCVYDTQPHQITKKEAGVFKSFEHAATSFASNANTECLFVRFPKDFQNTTNLLVPLAARVSKYLIIADTKLKQQPRIEEAMRELVSSKEWFVVEHNNTVGGITVLSREKPAKEVHAWLPERGVGTELKELLSKIGIHATPNCKCNARAATLDMNGVQYAKEHIEETIDWMEEEAKKRKLPFLRLGAKQLVKMAIRKVEKEERRIAKETS